jgi:hypothetical protein
MKQETIDKLFEAWAYCRWKEKSTESTLMYMAEVSGIEELEVAEFIRKTTIHDRVEWYRGNMDWSEKYKQ